MIWPQREGPEIVNNAGQGVTFVDERTAPDNDSQNWAHPWVPFVPDDERSFEPGQTEQCRRDKIQRTRVTLGRVDVATQGALKVSGQKRSTDHSLMHSVKRPKSVNGPQIVVNDDLGQFVDHADLGGINSSCCHLPPAQLTSETARVRADAQQEGRGALQIGRTPVPNAGVTTGKAAEILYKAGACWDFSYAEVWRKVPAWEGPVMVLDEKILSIHRDTDPIGGAVFRHMSKGFTFQLGEDLPGRVWATETCELVTKLHDIDESRFSRKSLAIAAGFIGVVAKAIRSGSEVVGVICAYLDSSLDSKAGMDVIMNDICKLEHVALELGKSMDTPGAVFINGFSPPRE